ncbi:MAG: hypothetical protein ACFHWX_09210 [Bacteroidota bacterium]
MSIKSHIASFSRVILFAFGITACQQVTLNEDQTTLLLTNMEAYAGMLDELNDGEINRLSDLLNETPGLSPHVKETVDQLNLLKDNLQEVSGELMSPDLYNKDVYITDIQIVKTDQLKLLDQKISQFQELVKPLSVEIYDELVSERKVLFDHLEGTHPAGVLDLVLMKYHVRIHRLMNQLFKKLADIEITPNARINFTDPYFTIQIVPETNILLSGDSLRFKLVDFAYFKAHPDSIVFSHNDQEFRFGEDYAAINYSIPIQTRIPVEQEIVTKSNYGLWLHGHTSFEYAEIRDTLRYEYLEPCE